MGEENSKQKNISEKTNLNMPDNNEKKNNNDNIINDNNNNNNNNNNLLQSNNDNFDSFIQPFNTSIIRKQNLSESASKYQHYLKFLYKNNFTSLTYEDLCAYMIQYRWRRFFIEEINKKKRGMIDVIYTSLNTNVVGSSKNNQTFLILDGKKYPYRCFDMMKYFGFKKLIEKLGGIEILPAIFINGFYIGSYEEFQNFEDNKMIGKLLINNNNNECVSCISCNAIRPNENLDVCPYCFKKYKFYAKFNEKYDLWKMRNEKQD
jgi:glutaredoxin